VKLLHLRFSLKCCEKMESCGDACPHVAFAIPENMHERDARPYIKLVSNYRRRQLPLLRRQAVPAHCEQTYHHRRRRT
jgi:hypothetical protein